MKKIILLLVISIFLTSFVNAQGWRKAYDTPIVQTWSGCMTDQNTAWLVGSTSVMNGVYSIYKSSDGGMTWTVKYQLAPTTISAGDICFGNSTTGYAGASKGNIFKTIDGGDTWQKEILDTNYMVAKLHFFDADFGFALCTNGTTNKICKTTNGGVSWDTIARMPSCSMEAMDFFSPTAGIATGDNGNIWYTTDGTTWTIKTSLTLHPPTGVVYSRLDQWAVKFISASTAVSCGWGSTSVGNEPTIFLKTTDAGVTWNQMTQSDENKTFVNGQSIYFKDQLNGIAVGGSTTPGTVICRTTDGGTTWIPLTTVSGFSPKIVIGYNDKVIVSGGNGDIIVSSDFGNSWTVANKHPMGPVSSVNIINNNIYACGYGGTFFKSTDSGVSFDMNYMVSGNKCLWSKGIYFLNENLGFAASQKGQALKTTNAGLTWNQVIRDSVSNFINNSSVYFINENIGFVVGNYNNNVDIIYKTTDGGTTWTNQVNQAFQNLNCVSFADANHGAAGGNHSTILFTTDQGVSWSVSTVNTTEQLAINGINFYDGLNGIAVGMEIILKTTDGGATWNRLALPGFAAAATFTAVCHNSNGLYIAGGKYCLKSTDAGNTWTNIVDTVFTAQNGFTSLNSIAVDNSGYIWIGGGSGMITNSPLVDGIKNNNVELNSFKLEQNYPNPFNPSTSINFSLNKHGFVTLKLFDVLGRLVREIYKGEMTAGQHNVNFNAGSLASGTYIYTLQMNDQFLCRKMMLLK
ncbi:MAG: YCF48-related protein [Ignavibacteriaceae bacterium]|nr:YCF48-related protein [Ignavibacteriaceae bacterium]